MTLTLELMPNLVWENYSYVQLQVNKSVGNEVQVNYIISTVDITAQGRCICFGGHWYSGTYRNYNVGEIMS